MITGHVSSDGVPIVELFLSGRTWNAVIDTGFNGDLEMPDSLFFVLNPRFIGRISWSLASGQSIEEDSYVVEVPFDGETISAIASFIPGQEILIGTGLLRRHRLEIDFPAALLQIAK